MVTAIRLTAAAAVLATLGAATATEAVNDNEKALALFKSMHETASSSGATEVTVRQAVTIEMQGMRQEMNSTYDVAVQWPDKLRMALADGMNGSTVVSDGDKLFVLIPMMERYTESDAPESVTVLFDEAEAMKLGVLDSGPLPLLGHVLHAETFAQLREALETEQVIATMSGVEEIDGTSCERVRLDMSAASMPGLGGVPGIDTLTDVRTTMDVWISSGDKPVLVRVQPEVGPVLKALAEKDPMMAQMGDVDMEMSMSFTGWSFTEELADDRFAFDPGEATKVDSFLEDMGGGEPEASMALVGEEAPTFTAEIFGGGELDLVKHRGKIVVLDFWATWCGPCVKALPILIETTGAFADQGVVFFAVDLREEDAKVRAFLDKHGFDMTVVMDREGKVGELYQVGPIPQTVIIGRDGTVEAVHIGYTPGLKERLTEEFQTLIDGGTLRDSH